MLFIKEYLSIRFWPLKHGFMQTILIQFTVQKVCFAQNKVVQAGNFNTVLDRHGHTLKVQLKFFFFFFHGVKNWMHFHSCHFEFLSSTENAAEKELWREDANYKDPGKFIFIQLCFPNLIN